MVLNNRLTWAAAVAATVLTGTVLTAPAVRAAGPGLEPAVPARPTVRQPLMMQAAPADQVDTQGGRAEVPQTPPAPLPQGGPTTAEDVAPGTTPTSTPLMRLLEKVGPNGGVGKSLEDAGISVTGYVEGGYVYNFSSPTGNLNTTQAFGQRHDSPELDQVELLAQRSVDYSKPFDAGFYIENIYGTDTAYFHANGLTLVSNGDVAGPFAGTGSTPTIHPKAQYDPTQFYFTLSSNAVAKGIGFQGGKFATILGYELIAPYTSGFTNPFYSHSLIFTQEPYTQTGALGIINLTDAFTFKGGITRGWDQATEDVNGPDIDYMGQVTYVVDKDLTVIVTGLTGNQQPSTPPGTVGQNGWRTTFDTVISYNVSDQLTLVANGDYTWEGQTDHAGAGGGIGQYYGVAGYARYTFSDFLQFNARGEWFNDPDGAAPTVYSPIRRPNQFYEFTLGTIIHPFPNTDLLNNFFIRPEVRLDYADKASFDPVAPAGNPSDHYYMTFQVDGVYAF